jgi:N-acyl-D-amino-acid deacylase
MTILIKNIQCVDGSGRPGFKADVLIRDKAIAAVGIFPNYRADKIIYGNGACLCPGFIDINTSSDRYLTLFSSPLHSDFLLQGVTSVLMGQCGFSLAPLLYGRLRSFEQWGRTSHVNTNWKSMREFLKALESQFKLGVNIATLAGHAVIREDIVRETGAFRKLSMNELRVMRSVLAQALEEGAFGMSAGLGHFPYQETPYHELRGLVDVVARHKGLYAVHLRDERAGIYESVYETIRLAQETSAWTLISHLRPHQGFEDLFDKAVKRIEEKSAQAHVHFDINPFPESAVLLDSIVPDFARHADRGLVLEMMKDAGAQKKILEGLPRLDARKTVIVNAPEMPFLNGKTLYEFSSNRKLSAQRGILELMRATRLKGVIAFENLSEEAIDRAMLSARALISSNSPSFDNEAVSYKPQRATATFSRYLEKASQAGVSIEKAIAKLTGTAAQLLNLDRRGFVSAGSWADLVMLDKDLHASMVMVNGQIVVEEGKLVAAPARSYGSILQKAK